MHAVISSKLDVITAVCRRFGVTRLEVFGSAARGDDFDPAASDADFLVDFAPRPDLSALEQFFGLAEALEGVLGRPVVRRPQSVPAGFHRAVAGACLCGVMRGSPVTPSGGSCRIA